MRLGGFLLPKRFSLAVWRKGVPHPLRAGHKVSVSSASPSSAWPPEISEVDKIIITRSSAPCPNSFTCSLPPAKDSHGFSLVNRVSPPIAFPIPHSLRAFTSSWSCFAMHPAFWLLWFIFTSFGPRVILCPEILLPCSWEMVGKGACIENSNFCRSLSPYPCVCVCRAECHCKVFQGVASILIFPCLTAIELTRLK